MEISPYPRCCGVHIINGFEHNPTKTHIEHGKKYILDRLAKQATGLYQIALNQHQKPNWDEALKEIGFQIVVNDFYNPNSGNTVSIYYKAVVEENVKPDVRPKKTKHSVLQGVNAGSFGY